MNVASIKSTVTAAVRDARERWPVVDHALAMLGHYGTVLGSQLAGAITYYGFLSFFPLVALAFAAVGYVVVFVPGAEAAVTTALENAFPGLVGTGSGQIDVARIASKKAGVGIVGLAVLLYSGLGWISAIRGAMRGVFRSVEQEKKRNFALGKALDLLVLVIIGVVLVVSVSVGGAMTGLTQQVVDFLGVAHLPGVDTLLVVAAVVVGIAASTVLFYVIFRLLPPRQVAPARALWSGALIAAIGFEVLKQLATVILSRVTANPLYGAFAIMIALLVWINYFARLTVLGACWVATAIPDSGAAEPGSAPTDAPDAARAGDAAGGVRLPGARPGSGQGGALAGLVAFAGVGWLVLRRRRAVAAGRHQ